jgi:hypothetical protein
VSRGVLLPPLCPTPSADSCVASAASLQPHPSALLLAANPAGRRYEEVQVVDLFGELAGISFTPEGDRLYISISGGCLCHSCLLHSSISVARCHSRLCVCRLVLEDTYTDAAWLL